jgi:catalase
LRNVAEELAHAVAEGLGLTELPEPLPKALNRTPKPELTQSSALSLLARPGQVGIRTRRIAILVADGVDGRAAGQIHESLLAAGATPRFVGVKMGPVSSSDGEPVEIEVSLEASPAVLWDASVFLDDGGLADSGQALEFLKDQYRHCKTVLILGSATTLLQKAGITAALESGDADPDPGLLVFDTADVESALPVFVAAVSRHRHFERETDPPRI